MSAANIEKTACRSELAEAAEPVLGFQKPLHWVVNQLPFPAATELGKALIDSNETVLGGPGPNKEASTTSAADDGEAVPHHNVVKGAVTTGGARDFVNGYLARNSDQLVAQSCHVD